MAPQATPAGRGTGRGSVRGGPAGGGPGGQPFAAAPGGRGAGRREDEERPGRTWDPDNPWETDEGVDPVVLPPPPAGRADPGPAIGFDR
jgi:hypothetical protein